MDKKHRTNWSEDQMVIGQSNWGLSDKGLFDKRTKWSMAELVKDQMLEDKVDINRCHDKQQV